MEKKKVIIIGSGIAGISAAVNLAMNGIKAIVVESRQHHGGRASSLMDDYTGELIDNGQHLFMGAYKCFLRLTKILGTYEYLLISKGIKIPFSSGEDDVTEFNTTSLPGKAGMILGLLKLGNLSFKSKVNSVNFLISLKNRKINENSLTVKELLIKYKFDEKSIKSFWEPLCLAVMNLKTSEADSGVFVEVLRRAFFTDKQSSSMIFSKVTLSELTAPYEKFIKVKGGEIHYGKKIDKIIFNNGKLKCLFSGEDKYEADYYISCIPPYRLKRIIEDKDIDKFRYLENFNYSGIISAYLWFEKDFLNNRIISLLNTDLQWIFNRRKIIEKPKIMNNNLKGHYALTISAADNIINLKNYQIKDILLKDMIKHFPQFTGLTPKHYIVLKDKFATIKLVPSAVSLRPDCSTDYSNFFLAGDWTNTELPATIESACLSGFRVSDMIIKLTGKDKKFS
jgi:squalene-associated FAD-dependent desaturase